MRGRGVKIAEVAAEAGVGVGTVSRVLNGSTQVRAETRRRVLEVIDRLGYRPSRLASALAAGATRSVAVLVPFITRPSVVTRLVGALSVLDVGGLDTIVCNIETPEQRQRHLGAFADQHRVAGMLVVSIPLTRRELEAITSTGVPVVLVDADSSGAPRVVIDNVAGGRMATEHLLGLGHRRIAFVGDAPNRPMRFRSSSGRLAGYREALAAAGVDAAPALVREVGHSATAAAEATLELLRSRDPPSAVFAASDTQALGVLRAAEQQGCRVPDDLSVIGFDDIDAAAMLRLSTVRQPLELSGAEGARRLCALLRGEVVPTRTVLPLELVARASTSPPGTARHLPPVPATAAS